MTLPLNKRIVWEWKGASSLKAFLSTPLPPNIPIMRGPYRSLVIAENDSQYDTLGLIALGKARDRYIMERKHSSMDPSMKPGEDFATIDSTMLTRTLRDISLSTPL